MERHVDARDHDGRARGDGIGLVYQGLERLLCAGDGVLLAADVVVDNLQELAGDLGDLSHPGVDVVGINTRHVRAQCGHGVLGVALRIARYQAAHGGAAGIDDVNNTLEVEDVRQRGKGGVFAQGMTGEVGGGR